MHRLILVAAVLLLSGCSGSSPMSPAPQAPSDTPSPPPAPAPAPATARYRVTFTATWSPATHPQEAPDNPHFSPLIGATHQSAVAFWRDGAQASEGIRRMAERGATSPLDQEIQSAIAAGTAQHLLRGANIDSPASTSIEFDVSQGHPLVTLVTMVAPSPDWFVGVSALPLFENGQWLADREVPLPAWDAGTDSGASFESPDLETVPRQPVSLIRTPPLAVNGQAAPLGTFRFTRIGS